MGVPSVSGSASVAASHAYKSDLNATAKLIFSGRGNLYGFLVEEMSGDDVFIQFFDAASAAAVTVGVTVPVMTMRVKADQSFGKDVNDSPLRFFGEGCVVAVTKTRTGNVAPAVDAVGNFWFHARNFSL
jgi:hypothetical protein